MIWIIFLSLFWIINLEVFDIEIDYVNGTQTYFAGWGNYIRGYNNYAGKM